MFLGSGQHFEPSPPAGVSRSNATTESGRTWHRRCTKSSALTCGRAICVSHSSLGGGKNTHVARFDRCLHGIRRIAPMETFRSSVSEAAIFSILKRRSQACEPDWAKTE